MDAEIPLLRPVDGRMIGGVCAAIGRRFGLDVSLVRTVTVILALLVVGIVAYLIAWLLIPQE